MEENKTIGSLDPTQIDLTGIIPGNSSTKPVNQNLQSTSTVSNADDAAASIKTAPSMSTPTSGTGVASSNGIDEDDITIADKKSPIVILFGPPSSGKSMTLVRLARYLRGQGYEVKTDNTFKSGTEYRIRCEKFHENLSTREALPGNALNEFLMVKIIKKGRTICQILEAPGEHFFNPSEYNMVSANNFRPYLTEMIQGIPNRKIWVFIAEAEWNLDDVKDINGKTVSGKTIKEAYVRRIRNCKNMLLQNKDRVVLLYNKVDQKEELFENGRLYVKSAETAMKDEYEGLAAIFKNENPITSLWRKFNYSFVPFSTGNYTKELGGTTKYTQSKDSYPHNLWQEIMKSVKG